MPKVHFFRSTRELCESWRKHKYLFLGDILVVEDEKVVGIASQNWPVAVTEKSGEFYQIHKEADLLKISQILQWPLTTIERALKEANKRSIKTTEKFERFLDGIQKNRSSRQAL